MNRILFTLSAVALCAAMTGSAWAGQVIKIGHNGTTDPNDPQNVAAECFKKEVEANSKGALTVQIYPAAQLGDGRSMVEGVQMGTIEVIDIENGPLGSFISDAMVWDLPYIFRDIDHAHKVLDGPIGKELQDKYLKIGLRHLGYNDGGFRYFTNSARPIRNLADIKNLKMRVMESEVMISTINAFGASAIPMAFGELYTALQQGVVDGQDNPYNLIYSNRIYEVQKYLSASQHFYYPRQYVVSEFFWKQLSPEMQKVVADGAKAACEAQRKSVADQDDGYRKTLIEKGMEFVSAEEFNKEEFAKVAREKVYPAFYKRIAGSDEAGKALIQRIIDTK